MAVLLAIVFAGSTSGVAAGPTTTSVRTPATPLARGLLVGQSFARANSYPETRQLATEMRLADPAQTYAAISDPSQLPARGSIGVFASGTSLWLRRMSPTGVQEVRAVAAGPDAGTYGPIEVDTTSAAGGRFDGPLAPEWTVTEGSGAVVALDTRIHSLAPASLRLTGTGRRTRTPTTVTQTLPVAQALPAGTVASVGLIARTQQLSRPVSVELRLDYRDGTYEFFPGTTLEPRTVVKGIPAGSSSGWHPITITALAARPLRSAVLFLVDTGTRPLRGTAWIDDVDIQLTTR